MRTEYRVTWQREGYRRKYVRKATHAAVQKLVANLAAYDPHHCGHETGLCDPMPPIVDGPRVYERQVTDWEPTR